MPVYSHHRAVPAGLLLLALFATVPAMAQDAWRCRAADGAIRYQDQPCAAGEAGQAIVFAPVPPAATSPAYLLPPPTTGVRYAVPRASAPGSFECRAANGEVFYRHGRCPATIPAALRTQGGRAQRASGSVRVTARPLSRREACRRMHAAGSGARAGRERDEDVSTYERNLGRDPCR